MHGGDIYNNKIKYDFSVNLNPYAPYEEVTDTIYDSVKHINQYPEYDSNMLRKALANTYGLDYEWVCVSNGASEAIRSIVNAVQPQKVYIEVPAFSGYEYAAGMLNQVDITYVTRTERLSSVSIEYMPGSLVFVANPANPTGYSCTADELMNLYEKVSKCGAYLIVDESFILLSEKYDQSMIEKIKQTPEELRNLFVVRSFTKSFSIPGIRLGYFVCADKNMVSRAFKMQSEWSVSTIAQETGIECLKYADRVKSDYEKIRTERELLMERLNEQGFNVFNSDTCYVLFSGPNYLYDDLREKCILIRDCSDYIGIERFKRCEGNLSEKVYRVAVSTRENNEILVGAIEKIISKHRG